MRAPRLLSVTVAAAAVLGGLTAAHALDDDGGSAGGPPWAVTVWGPDDRPCVAAGRLVDGKVGALVEGRFTEYPRHEGGSCVDLDRVPAGAQVTAPAAGDGPTVVHGLAGPDVRSISVRAGEVEVAPRPGPRGGFVVPLEARTRLEDVDVVVVLRDGSSRTLL